MIAYDVRNLSYTYAGQPQPANKDITLQIQQGEIYGLLGENGAGKSTLVRQMVSLLRPTAGSITLFGRDTVADPLHVNMAVGYMPQDALALNTLTVAEALYFTAHLRGLSRRDALRERDALLDLWELGPLRAGISNRLSGGQKRLLQLAVAMAGSPPVLILDEPTNNLDPQRRRRVWEVLRRLNQEHGTTVIFITHDAVEAEKAIQRVGIMRAAELVAIGRPGELKRMVDRKLRLELFFAPESPPALPPHLTCHHVEVGRWLVLLERHEAAAVLNGLDLSRLDDFRLYSATLEDLYLYYARPT